MISRKDLCAMNERELKAFAAEIRARILAAVSASGGHLASNLGVVEATIALHRVFNVPADTIVFDVGHQCYTHKILTGREAEMDTLRRAGGLSGFPNREESEADPFTTGHSGTSLSAALGMAEANRLAGRDDWIVAVIGDGSFTNGMIYEALNGCARRNLKLMIVLNDNEMSISKNVGALPDYFAKIRTSRRYFAFKHTVQRVCRRIPFLGRPLIACAIYIKEFIKRVLNKKNVFESFGLEYLGPINGNDIASLEGVLCEAKQCDIPCVVHIITQKGRGYPPAAAHPENYHAVPPFPLGGELPARGDSFSAAFGRTICDIAARDSRICAVTAAMRDGVGLCDFATKFPDRFFDVGIAEEHAITFAAGLARAGCVPVVAMYSTFAQRVFDQLLHDAALQKLPLILALDRCGLVPGDGVTHQGLFDVGLFTPIPGVRVYAPVSYDEVRAALETATADGGISVIRYPRGAQVPQTAHTWLPSPAGDSLTTVIGTGARRVTLITYGSETAETVAAAEALADTCTVRVVRLYRLSPLPQKDILAAVQDAEMLCVAEEAMRRGGIGEQIAALITEARPALPMRICATEDFVPHGVTATDLPISRDAIAKAVADGMQRL